MPPTLFLDRDGVLNVDRSYVYRLEDLELMPGVGGALAEAADAGFRLIVITNQGGIGLDYYSAAQMTAFNGELAAELLKASDGKAQIDAFYHCPHHPEAIDPALRSSCECRKPGTGMIDNALRDFPEIDPASSWLIGDKISDIDCARAAGLAGAVQVLGIYAPHPSPDAAFDTVPEAVAHVLQAQA